MTSYHDRKKTVAQSDSELLICDGSKVKGQTSKVLSLSFESGGLESRVNSISCQTSNVICHMSMIRYGRGTVSTSLCKAAATNPNVEVGLVTLEVHKLHRL